MLLKGGRGWVDIKWLKTFIVAAKYENFRITSEELFLTQPAITKHMQRLEGFLQVQLFEKSGKHICLSPAGARFLPNAKRIVQSYEEGMKDFELWKQGYNQKLVIASAPQIASSILPNLVRAFVDEHPTMEVIIEVHKSYDIGKEVSTNRADVGLTRIRPVEPNISIEFIHEEPVVLVAPYENHNRINEAIALKEYRLITHNHPDYWNSLLESVKRFNPQIRTMAVKQVEVTKRFVEEGLGVSYLPLSMVKKELGESKFVQIRSNKVIPPTSSTFIITKTKSEEVEKFTRFIKDEFD